MKDYLKYITLCLALFVGLRASTQTYPVQAFVQVSPPYNSYLPDYADPFTNQMRVLLTLTDFSVPSAQVKLRFSIEGPGYSMQSVDLIAFPTITLTPGVPVEIAGSDLAPYLQTENLVFSGLNQADYEFSKVLPEGPATICVQVVDATSASQPTIGNPACAQTWFSLYDPPLLNLPFCETEITPVDPQAVLFSWTPLHMASPLSGSTEYIFELFEIRPEMGDPNVVVNSSLPTYSETTTFTYVNYGIVQPQLQVGLSYVWRVKARDASGRDLYRNQGYSTVCTFTYGSIAGSLIGDITLELNANGTGVRQGLTWWNASDLFDSYTLEVRKTGNPDFEWFPYTASSGELKVNSLEPETEYECRVKGIAGGAETDWSNTATFNTQPAPNYACGSQVMPPVSPLDKPLDYLLPGNIVAVGQFEMTVTSAEPSGLPGHFRGRGKVNIPFMLLNINVEYEDIYIDDNMIMREGRVDAITKGMDEWLDDMFTIFIDGVIDQPGGFEFNDDSTVTVNFGGQSLTYEFTSAAPLVFEDDSGLTYTVYPDGTIEISGDITWDEDVLAATANHNITFHEYTDQTYGFDEKRYLQWMRHYPCIALDDESLYFVPYKSVGSAATDVVMAHIISETVIVAPRFELEDGTVLSSTRVNDSTYQVTVGSVVTSKRIYAYDDLGAKIGKLNLSVYTEKERNVVVVPVNEATIPATLQTELNSIFSQANVTFNVTQAAAYENDDYDQGLEGLESPNATLMEKYSLEMRALRDAYFEAYPKESNTYYLFVVPEFDSDLDGYMVRGKAIGFVKSGESAHTYAHELAHGAFGLEHTFPAIPTGSTNNLMDYTADQTHLTHDQWLQMQEFNPVFSMLDDEEDGSMAIVNTNDYSDLFELANPDGSMTFLSPSGIPITIKGTIAQLKFTTYEDRWKDQETGVRLEDSQVPLGALIGFKLNGDNYYAKANGGATTFLGYKKGGSSDYYVDSLSFKPNHTPVILTPTYSIAGFAANASHTNVKANFWDIDSTNTANGPMLGAWGFLTYTSMDSIENGVAVYPSFTHTISEESLRILAELIYNNEVSGLPEEEAAVPEYVEEGSILYDLLDGLELEDMGPSLTDEVYYNYEALMLYNAAYLIESTESAPDCYANFSQIASQSVESDLFEKYYNEMVDGQEDFNTALEGTLGLGNDNLVFDLIIPSAPLYAVIALPEQRVDYKRRRIKQVFGNLIFYNNIIAIADELQALSDSESELVVQHVISLNSYDALGDCMLMLLNPATKLKILNRVREYEASDFKEELIVRILENTTPAQFEEMMLAQSSCSMLHMLNDDLWFSHYDRYANRISYLLLEYKKAQGYDLATLPTFPLFKDGINPWDSEIEHSLQGCNVTFDAQIWGPLNNEQATYHATDLVLFNIEDNFDFPAFDGTFLEIGDTLLAPAFWAYYFLSEHDQHANLTALRYFAEAALIIATSGGASAWVINIEAGLLAADYAIAALKDEYPDSEVLDVLQNTVMALSVVIPLSATNQIVKNGITKMPWIHTISNGATKTVTFVADELVDYIRLLRKNSGDLDLALKKIDDLIIALRDSRYAAPLKNSFITFLLKAQIDIGVSKYCRVLDQSRLVVNGGKIFVRLEENFKGFSKGEVFEIGNFGKKPATQEIYISEPQLYEAAYGPVDDIVYLDDILVKEGEVYSYKSYKAVMTTEGQVYLKLLDDGVVELANVGTGVFRKLSSGNSLADESVAAIEDLLSDATAIKFDYSGRSLEYPIDFLNESDSKMYDIIFDNGVYVKFDNATGRMLYVDGDSYYFVKTSKGFNVAEGVDILIVDKVNRFRNMLGLNGPVTVDLISEVGGPIVTSSSKVSTFIGKLNDTEVIKAKFGNFTNMRVGEGAGELNILNIPNAYYNPSSWFVDHNKGWMLRAIERNDDIYLASEINSKSLLNIAENGEPYGSYFANELYQLILYNIKPINISEGTWDALKVQITNAANTPYPTK